MCSPSCTCGRYPAKAVPGELVEVTATVFREGHEMLGAGVVLRDPRGPQPSPGDHARAGAGHRPLRRLRSPRPARALWQFRVEAWGDPIAQWYHDAGIKVPIGQDVELMLAEGVLLLRPGGRRHPGRPRRRPGRGQGRPGGRAALAELAARLRRRAAAPDGPAGRGQRAAGGRILRQFPLRDLVTRSPFAAR